MIKTTNYNLYGRDNRSRKALIFMALNSVSLTNLFLLYMLNRIHSKKFVVLRMVS